MCYNSYVGGIMDLEYKIENNEFHNVKEVLKAKFHISDRLLTKLKKSHKIFLNSNPCYVTTILNNNDIVSVNLDFEEETPNIVSTKIDLNIIFEDEYLLIINKPANLPVHPSQSHYENSLSNRSQVLF